MAAEDFSAVHKVAYGEGVPELVPDLALVQKDIKFESSKLLGDYFEQTVRLALPGGFTRAKGDGSAGLVTLAGATAGVLKKAKVYGFQLILQDQISYEDLSKAAKGGPQAYKKSTALFWEGMQLSMRKMLEIMCLYGNVGIGKVSAYSASNAAYDNQPTITIAEADWAPQIWCGFEGSTLSVMSAATSTERGEANIVSVDIDNRVVVLSATVTGATANDIVYFKDGYGAEMFGLAAILANTGTMFNISAATHQNWKSAQHAVNGAFSFQALKKVSKGSAKGLMGNINVYCSDGAFDDLTGDIHQLRSVDKSEVRRIELGSDVVVFKRGGVTATIKPHAMLKNKHAMGIPTELAKRVGAADFSFGIPGGEDERIWFDLEGKTGKEGRAYTHQGIFLEQPGIAIEWTGITNRTT